jgi:hypothetical protein
VIGAAALVGGFNRSTHSKSIDADPQYRPERPIPDGCHRPLSGNPIAARTTQLTSYQSFAVGSGGCKLRGEREGLGRKTRAGPVEATLDGGTLNVLPPG